LDTVSPRKLLERIRGSLRRAEKARFGREGIATGWAYLGLDVEYNEVLGVFSFHVHAIASGEVAELLSELRDRRKFRSVLEDAPTPVVRQSVSRQAIAQTVNYVTKAYHGKRMIWEENGSLKRGHIVRMPAPIGAKFLLWMGQWTIDDWTKLIGLTYRGDCLHMSKKASSNKAER
jgi:hypothetical protein